MSSRKAWLKDLASRSKEAWLTAVTPRELDGFTRMETRRTIYSLKDGVCYEVMRRDFEPVDEAPFIGLRIVGWVTEEEKVIASWRPGARAILWRPGAPGEEAAIAVTSPAFGFLRVLPTPTEEDDETLTTLRRRGLSPRAPAPMSATRILSAVSA